MEVMKIKVVKFLLKAIAIIYVMAFSIGMGAELYRSSPEFRRGYEQGRDWGFKKTCNTIPKKEVEHMHLKRYVTIKGIGY